MTWNGSGTFSRSYSWTNDAANSIPITASRMDADTNDIVSNGLNNCVTRDGQGKISANFNANNYSITGLNAGTLSSPSISFQSGTNTGIYFPAAGQLAGVSGGVQSFLATATNFSIPGTFSVSGSLTTSGSDANFSAGGNRAFFDYASGGIRFGSLSGGAVSAGGLGISFYGVQAGTSANSVLALFNGGGGLVINTPSGNFNSLTVNPNTNNSGSTTAAFYAGGGASGQGLAIDILGNTNTNNPAVIRFLNNAYSLANFQIYSDNTYSNVGTLSATPLTLVTGNANRLSIAANGQTAIQGGAFSPVFAVNPTTLAGNGTMQVFGGPTSGVTIDHIGPVGGSSPTNMRFYTSGYGQQTFSLYADTAQAILNTTGATPLYLQTANVTRLTIASSGSVQVAGQLGTGNARWSYSNPNAVAAAGTVNYATATITPTNITGYSSGVVTVAQPGTYLVTATVFIGNTVVNSGSGVVEIFVNGSATGYKSDFVVGSGFNNHTLTVTGIVNLSASNTVQIQVSSLSNAGTTAGYGTFTGYLLP